MSRFYYDQATRHYARGQYEAAVEQFFLAQRLSPNPRTLYNIGLCFLQMRRHADAFHFLGEYLAQSDEAQGAEDRRALARETIDDIRPRVARVRVTSRPQGATIFVDQREHGAWGQTPRVLALPPGAHSIWVERQGYRRAETEIEAVKGELVEITLEPERILGTLRIDAPEGASVRALDDAGTVVAEGPAPLKARVPPGRYEVEITAEAYRPYRRLVGVSPEQTTHLSPRLERRPPPTGSLAITADVAQAVVEIDGEPAGFTPLTLPGLATREHHIEVSAPEHMAWEGDVEIAANEQRWVRVRLAEEPHGRSPLTWAMGGLGAGLLVAGGVTGGFALARHADFAEEHGTLDAESLGGERRRGRVLNATTDVLLSLGLVSFATGVVLFFTTGDRGDRESTAIVSEGAR